MSSENNSSELTRSRAETRRVSRIKSSLPPLPRAQVDAALLIASVLSSPRRGRKCSCCWGGRRRCRGKCACQSLPAQSGIYIVFHVVSILLPCPGPHCKVEQDSPTVKPSLCPPAMAPMRACYPSTDGKLCSQEAEQMF